MSIESDIQKIVADVLGDSADKHSDRCEPDRTKRELRQVVCTHGAWNALKNWCDYCGATKEQIVFSAAHKN